MERWQPRSAFDSGIVFDVNLPDIAILRSDLARQANPVAVRDANLSFDMVDERRTLLKRTAQQKEMKTRPMHCVET